MNLYELITQIHSNGLELKHIQRILADVVDALEKIHSLGYVHGDIKPENIVVMNGGAIHVALIDLGGAIPVNGELISYAVSRFYRPPEIVLRLPFSYSLDIWSLGCVAAELFMSQPLFLAANQMNLIHLITKRMGPIPQHMIDSSPIKNQFFKKDSTLKDELTYCKEHNKLPSPNPDIYIHELLNDIIINNRYRADITEEETQLETNNRETFVDLLKKMLSIDPNERISLQGIREHPFMNLAL